MSKKEVTGFCNENNLPPKNYEKMKPKDTATHPWRKKNDVLKNDSMKALFEKRIEKLK
jgi:hypothetical protein